MIDYGLLRKSDWLRGVAAADTGVTLSERGVTLRCPLHEESNGRSFSVCRGRDGVWRWKCHGACQRGGDVMDYMVAAGYARDVRTAALMLSGGAPSLSRRFGAGLFPDASLLNRSASSGTGSPHFLPSRSRRAPTPEDLGGVWPLWRAALRPDTPAARYLEGRLGPGWAAVAARYRLGVVPQGWSASWVSQAWADAARGRVALPLTAGDGRVWSAVLRAAVERPGGATALAAARYLSVPGRRRFAPWFGVDVAAAAGVESLWVAEGPFDVLAAAAFTDRVAVSVTAGAAVDTAAVDQLRAWLPSVRRVTVVMDGDPAGRSYAGKVAVLCRRAGLDVSIRDLPEGMDLAEMLRARAAAPPPPETTPPSRAPARRGSSEPRHR